MLFGDRLSEIRKKKKISQDDLAKKIGVHAPVIGRYERSDVKPSIEVAVKITEALNVSLDYLVGSTDLILEKGIVNRIQSNQKLSKDDKGHLFALMDAFLLKCNIQSNLAV
ncbi:MAG TPA: helix-turn-helix transcriptional regulator [Bacteroidales bacterium]|nr:helix-turn-helix transcriptional regulator [Bacteroidales bacterium]